MSVEETLARAALRFSNFADVLLFTQKLVQTKDGDFSLSELNLIAICSTSYLESQRKALRKIKEIK